LAIRRHPLKGARILEPLGFSYAIFSGIRHHHESWDGKGYPNGLASEEIPLLARVISLADFYDAMTSDRPYRKETAFQKAYDEIEENSQVQFDPHIVGIFLDFKSQQRLVPISFDSDSR
jgi:HD-GYP domain-containing protein (c-di-GMP phosphodiesterase class II)